jgi:hypothetical protein
MTQSNLVRRKISLPDTVSIELIERCIFVMSDNPAIHKVKYNQAGNFLSVEYDQLQTNYSSLLAILSKLGITYSKDFSFKFRKGWYDYLDDNTRESA